MQTKGGPPRLIGEVQMLRIRVAKAEPELRILREQARQAKRRRKEAKRVAQRARKQFKRFKADLAGLQRALAKAEAKLFQAGGRALARKVARRTRALATVHRVVRHAKARVRKPPASTVVSRSPKRVIRKRPAVEKAQPVILAPAPADAHATQPPPPPTNAEPTITTL